MRRLSEAEVDTFERKGYLIVPGVFGEAEVAGFRRKILEMARDNSLFTSPAGGSVLFFHGSLSNYEGLADVVFDDRILGIARDLLGEEIAFFGDTSVQMGKGGREFHRDSTDRINLLGRDWDGPYPLLRFGIYLGDFARDSGGLKVVSGSHRSWWSLLQPGAGRLTGFAARVFTLPFRWVRRLRSLVQGGTFVPSRDGDVVVWNFRLLHSGNAVRLKSWPSLSLPPWLEDLIPASMAMGGGADRIAMFLAFAKPGEPLKRYLEARRSVDLEAWKRSRWDEEIERTCREKGIVTWKPSPEFGSLCRRWRPA